MKRIMLLSTMIAMTLMLFGCGSSSTSNDDAESNNDAAQEQKQEESSGKSEFNVGDTWEVPNQWKLTIDSITETDYRNEFADTDPAAVYIIEYTYENTGYEDDYMDGLFLDLEFGQIVDANNTMGYSYPAEVDMYPQEVPVGASTTAQVAIGVDNPGDFVIHMSEYDGNGKNQKATFNCAVS